MSSSGSLGIGFPFAAESSYSHTVGIVLQVWERLRKYQDQIGGITVVLQCHSFGLSTSSSSSFRMKYKTGKNTIKAFGFSERRKLIFFSRRSVVWASQHRLKVLCKQVVNVLHSDAAVCIEIPSVNSSPLPNLRGSAWKWRDVGV